MTLATELAERVGAMQFSDLPADAIHWAKVGVLDWVGVTLAGHAEPCAQLAARVSAAPGPALLFGSGGRVAALDAALINGTASHALDFDDCSDTMGGHPTAPILPALFALADQMRADGISVSGQHFLTAYVAGFEVETRLGRAVNFHHYEKGWHPTATLGVFGAATACARLMGLDVAQTTVAISIAASFASGLKANFGTMTKPLHVGHCARNGLYAALLAREGYTASDNVFEHKQGFFMVYNGEGNFDASRVLADWANPLDILKPGIAIKQYPCCASTHPAIDVMIELATTHDLLPEMVESVDCWTHPRRLNHTNRPDPRSALDAKFSVQYCVARGLQNRRVVLSDFDGAAHDEPGIRAIMDRIHAAPHPEMKMASTEHFGSEIRLHLKDGRVITGTTDRPLGRGPTKPLPIPRLEAKFIDCAVQALDEDSARRTLETIWNFDTLNDLGGLGSILADGVITTTTAH
jgi:2-methylcitrate dehydratase PrpD